MRLTLKKNLIQQCCRFSTANPKPASADRLKMHAWQIHSYSGLEDLQYSPNVKIPMISSSTDVLVKVKAAGVNSIDVAISSGYGSSVLNAMRCNRGNIEFPITLGREFTGIVVQKGMGSAADLKIGDEVWGVVPPHKNGSFADYVVVSDYCISKKPESLDSVDASGVLYAGLTAWSGLFLSGQLGGIEGSLCPSGGSQAKGKRVLVLGASGGVGTIALQILKAEGVTTFATCSTDAGPLVKNLGADYVFDYSNPEDMRELEKCGPLDIILDCAGQGTEFAHKLNLKFVNYVTFSSPFLKNIDQSGFPLGILQNITNLVENNAKSVIGKNGGLIKWGYFVPAPQGIEYLKRLVEKRKLLPVIDSCFNIKEVDQAMEKVKNGHLRGKVVVSTDIEQ